MSSNLVLINPIKKNENSLIYSKNTVFKIYDGLLRQSGQPIFDIHIQAGVDLIPNLIIHPYYKLVGECIYYWHDIVEDFFQTANTSIPNRQILNTSKTNLPIILKTIINSYDIRNSQILNSSNTGSYNITLNSLFENAEQLGNDICFGVYKITKRSSDSDYLGEVLKFSNKSNINFNLISKEEIKFLDLVVLLDKMVDIYENNLDYNEVSLDPDKHWIFLAKKLRNSLDKYFFDIGVLGKMEKILIENKDIKVDDEKLFDINVASQILYDIKDNILNFFESHPISQIIENVGLGSKVTNKNFKHYQFLLDRLYFEKSYLFDKKPELKLN